MKKALPLVAVLLIGFYLATDQAEFTNRAQALVGWSIDMLGAVSSWIVGAISQT